MLIPGEVKFGDIVIYDGDEKVQVHLTDQRLLIKGNEYLFKHWNATMLTGIHLWGFDEKVFPARVFTKKVKPVPKEVADLVPTVFGGGQ